LNSCITSSFTAAEDIHSIGSCRSQGGARFLASASTVAEAGYGSVMRHDRCIYPLVFTSNLLQYVINCHLKSVIMNKLYTTLFALLLIISSASGQKYKSIADTFRLNKDFMELAEDIEELTAKLSSAESKLSHYQSKANKAASEAEQAAKESSKQARKATDGDLSDTKKATKKAKEAYKDAEDATDAKNELRDHEKRIEKLQSQLQSKKERLEELQAIRNKFRNG
jgi:hypothetical protein